MGILLDTSALISLVDKNRPNHSTAAQYYRLALEQRVPMFLSAIVVSEFSIKQPLADLPLKQFHTLPFNVPHAVRSAELWNRIKRDDKDSRSVVRDDIKLLAQADKENIPIILTEDENTLHKYCARLRQQGVIQIRTVLLVDGFDPNGLRADGQRGLQFFSSDTSKTNSPSK